MKQLIDIEIIAEHPIQIAGTAPAPNDVLFIDNREGRYPRLQKLHLRDFIKKYPELSEYVTVKAYKARKKLIKTWGL